MFWKCNELIQKSLGEPRMPPMSTHEDFRRKIGRTWRQEAEGTTKRKDRARLNGQGTKPLVRKRQANMIQGRCKNQQPRCQGWLKPLRRGRNSSLARGTQCPSTGEGRPTWFCLKVMCLACWAPPWRSCSTTGALVSSVETPRPRHGPLFRAWSSQTTP